MASVSCAPEPTYEPIGVAPAGSAPGLHANVSPDGRTHVLVFSPGDEVLSGIAEYAKTNGLVGASFSGIGSFAKARLGAYDPSKHAYRVIPLDEPLEVVSFTGNVSTLVEKGGEPSVHAHVVVGLLDGTTRGGHLLSGEISLTLEVFVTDLGTELPKQPDDDLGIQSLRPTAAR